MVQKRDQISEKVNQFRDWCDMSGGNVPRPPVVNENRSFAAACQFPYSGVTIQFHGPNPDTGDEALIDAIGPDGNVYFEHSGDLNDFKTERGEFVVQQGRFELPLDEVRRTAPRSRNVGLSVTPNGL